MKNTMKTGMKNSRNEGKKTVGKQSERTPVDLSGEGTRFTRHVTVVLPTAYEYSTRREEDE